MVRTGGVEPPQRAATGLQPAELADAQRPRERGDRPDSNRYREVHDLGCCRYTTATMKAGDRPAKPGSLLSGVDKRRLGRRAGTTGLEPAAYRLTSECSCR